MSSKLECASSIQQYNATAQVSLPCHDQSMNRQQSNVRDTIIICQKNYSADDRRIFLRANWIA